VLTSCKKCDIFHLAGTEYDARYYGGEHVYGAIDFEGLVMVSEEEYGISDRPSMRS
jgi:hypothetical protein